MSQSMLPSSNFWRNQLRQWHWISSALCLVGLLLFALTGITLNHAAQIEAAPKTTRLEKNLSGESLDYLAKAQDGRAPPPELTRALIDLVGVNVAQNIAEVSEDDIFIDMSGPGVTMTLTIEKSDGFVTYERTDRGIVAVLNDLHKGRHTGPLWAWFIDILAIACVLFSVTGLGLLWLYARNRPITWPLVIAGLVAPFILYMVFVHV